MKTQMPTKAALLLTCLAFTVQPLFAGTLDKIAQTHTMTVSYREAAIPFSYLAQGEPVGFAKDVTEAIIKDVKKKLNLSYLEVHYLPVTGQNRIPLLVNGTYDLECGSTTNNSARGKEVAFSINYFYSGTRLLTKKASGIGKYADLSTKTVATAAGSTNEKIIRKYSADHNLDMLIITVKDYSDGLLMVENGRADALALDDILLYGLRANSTAPKDLVVVGDALQVEPYACMVRKDDPEFKQLVDNTITRLVKTGEFTRLYGKWFESPIPPKSVILNMPMSEALKANLKELSDKPAQ